MIEKYLYFWLLSKSYGFQNLEIIVENLVHCIGDKNGYCGSNVVDFRVWQSWYFYRKARIGMKQKFGKLDFSLQIMSSL